MYFVFNLVNKRWACRMMSKGYRLSTPLSHQVRDSYTPTLRDPKKRRGKQYKEEDIIVYNQSSRIETTTMAGSL